MLLVPGGSARPMWKEGPASKVYPPTLKEWAAPPGAGSKTGQDSSNG